MKHKVTLIFLLVILISVFSFQLTAQTAEQLVQIAVSLPDYPVTPGDIYQVSYYAVGSSSTSMADNLVTLTLIVDSSYRLKVASLGTLNVAGKTFLQVKNDIESLVSKNYPLSGVQVTMRSIGNFKVKITGEVTNSGELLTNGVTRLSSLLTSLTNKASLRAVTVTGANGVMRTYDLMQASRYGRMDQDPYLRPNDVVNIPEAVLKVNISGTVARPGTYDLLGGEGLKELVEIYGGGFTPEADPRQITIVRTNPTGVGSEKFFVDYSAVQVYALQYGDSVQVTDKKQSLPRVYFEGALIANGLSDKNTQNKFETTSTSVTPTTRIEYLLYGNDTVGRAAINLQNSFYSGSDLENAYIKRGMLNIPVDLTRFLYHNDFSKDMPLQIGDTIIVPFRQYYVLVIGAVNAPGRFPYVPDKTAQFYINLAGGFNPELSGGFGLKITDAENNKVDKNSIVPPEATITVPITNGIYYINRYSGVILTVASLITTIFTVTSLFKTQ